MGMRELALVAAAVGSLAAAVPAPACTSFLMDTPGGPVFGANLDLRFGEGLVLVNRRGLDKEGFQRNASGETMRWHARYGSVTFNLVGRELPWGGMNEAGLAVAGMALEITGFPSADDRHPVGSSTWTQFVLDTCATVGEVIAAQDSIRLAGDRVHFLVADAAGACAAIECLGGETIIHTGDDLPVHALANAAYRDCLAFIETGAAPRFNPGRSAERVAAAAHWAGRYDPAAGIEAPDWALGILTEAVVDPKTFWKKLGNDPYTRWSVACDLTARELRFRTVDHEPVRTLAFAGLDFACDAPVLMLDVNAELEGPVEDDLLPYDSDVNYAVAREFLERWGFELSDEEVRDLTTFLESYPCSP